MERECLDILLRGRQPVILCPARGLARLRIGPEARRALTDGRLLMLSQWPEGNRRTTARQAQRRNEFVAALSDALWIPHAVPSGKAWSTAQSALTRHHPVYTFPTKANTHLQQAGAHPFAELHHADFTAENQHP